jgi:hypothetical protein
MPDLFSLLSEQSLQQLEVAITQTGFHFTGNKTNLNQLETFSITQMGVKI